MVLGGCVVLYVRSPCTGNDRQKARKAFTSKVDSRTDPTGSVENCKARTSARPDSTSQGRESGGEWVDAFQLGDLCCHTKNHSHNACPACAVAGVLRMAGFLRSLKSAVRNVSLCGWVCLQPEPPKSQTLHPTPKILCPEPSKIPQHFRYSRIPEPPTRRTTSLL